MVNQTNTILCDGCGVEITWSPITASERSFCCVDCQQGRPCTCGDRMEVDDEHRDNISAMFEPGKKI
jgi:hypothetical protein